MKRNEFGIECNYIWGENNEVLNAHSYKNVQFPYCVAVSVLEGSYYVEINEKKYIARKGETVFVPCFVLCNVGMEEPGEITFSRFTCFFLSIDILNFLYKDCFIVKNSAIPEILQNLNNCKELNSLKKKIYIDKLILELLIELEKDNAISFEWFITDSAIVKAIDYIISHINECKDILMDEVIKESGYGKTYFYKVFKKEVKMTPKEYIEQERLKKATVLLANNMKPLKIAEYLRFGDYNHFCKKFKKFFGVSPTKYRKMLNDMNGGDKL